MRYAKRFLGLILGGEKTRALNYLSLASSRYLIDKDTESPTWHKNFVSPQNQAQANLQQYNPLIGFFHKLLFNQYK